MPTLRKQAIVKAGTGSGLYLVSCSIASYYGSEFIVAAVGKSGISEPGSVNSGPGRQDVFDT